jgi:hypothetical protein
MGADSRAREVGVGKRALRGARASRSGRTAHVARCRVAEASGAVASGQVGYFFFRRRGGCGMDDGVQRLREKDLVRPGRTPTLVRPRLDAARVGG